MSSFTCFFNRLYLIDMKFHFCWSRGTDTILYFAASVGLASYGIVITLGATREMPVYEP